MNLYNNYQFGGYPYGYPPQPMPIQQAQYNNWAYIQQVQQAMNSPYSPFPNSQLSNVYVDPNGQVVGAGEGPISNQNIPNPQNQTPVMAGQPNSYNPFTQYGAANQPQQQSFNGYMNQPGYYQPYGYNNISYGYNGYYPTNSYEAQYQSYLNTQLYTADPPSIDPFEYLRGVVLSDDERKLSELHTPKGYNYNGNPYYDNAQITEINKAIKKSKERTIDFWSRLSMAAHKACGDNITEDEIRAYYDPEQYMKNNSYNNPVKNYYDMTREELEYMNKMAQVDQTAMLARKFEMADYYQQTLEQKRAEGYAKIKQSHDQILGLTPENMTLKNYMENAGLLLADIALKQHMRKMKNGTNKYNQGNYKNMVSNGNNQPISMFTDDSYIPLESRIKEKYLTAKAKSMESLVGEYNPSPPPYVNPQDALNRQAFLQSAMRGIKI